MDLSLLMLPETFAQQNSDQRPQSNTRVTFFSKKAVSDIEVLCHE